MSTSHASSRGRRRRGSIPLDIGAPAADARDARVDELLDAITATRPGSTTTWVTNDVTVTVYGQRRYELEVPTPWAQITVNGRLVVVRTWEQLLEQIDAASENPRQRSPAGGPDA